MTFQKWLVLDTEATMAVPFYKESYARTFMAMQKTPCSLLKRDEEDGIWYLV